MTPIDKVQARATAFEALGIDVHATSSDIRAAWRRIAFEKHQGVGKAIQEEFAHAKQAYDFLKNEIRAGRLPEQNAAATATARPAPPPSPMNRPNITPRTIRFSAAEIAACRDALAAHRPAVAAHGEAAVIAMGSTTHASQAMRSPMADHVPEAVLRQGRSLIYTIPTPLAVGGNRVALPHAFTDGKPRVKPVVLTILTSALGFLEISIPEEMRARLLPEARKVRIRFSED